MPENPENVLTRRTALASALAAGATAFAADASQTQNARDARRSAPRRYQMKKSINLWAFPYRSWCTFEYFHPFAHYPEALAYQTSDALDRILGRK